MKYLCCDYWQCGPYPKPIFPPKSHADALGLTHVLRAVWQRLIAWARRRAQT